MQSPTAQKMRMDSNLEHLVRTGFNTRNHVSRAESNLLHLGKVILWIAVEYHTTYRNQREFALRPNLKEKGMNE